MVVMAVVLQAGDSMSHLLTSHAILHPTGSQKLPIPSQRPPCPFLRREVNLPHLLCQCASQPPPPRAVHPKAPPPARRGKAFSALPSGPSSSLNRLRAEASKVFPWTVTSVNPSVASAGAAPVRSFSATSAQLTASMSRSSSIGVDLAALGNPALSGTLSSAADLAERMDDVDRAAAAVVMVGGGVLCGDEEEDARVRNLHHYVNTPSPALFLVGGMRAQGRPFVSFCHGGILERCTGVFTPL